MVNTMTTRDAASVLGISISTMNRLAADGTIAPIAKAPGPRGANLYDPNDIERLRAKRAALAAPDMRVRELVWCTLHNPRETHINPQTAHQLTDECTEPHFSGVYEDENGARYQRQDGFVQRRSQKASA